MIEKKWTNLILCNITNYFKLIGSLTFASVSVPCMIIYYSHHQLLCAHPTERLGGGAAGAQEVKDHPFFTGVQWLSPWTPINIEPTTHTNPYNTKSTQQHLILGTLIIWELSIRVPDPHTVSYPDTQSTCYPYRVSQYVSQWEAKKKSSMSWSSGFRWPLKVKGLLCIECIVLVRWLTDWEVQ